MERDNILQFEALLLDRTLFTSMSASMNLPSSLTGTVPVNITHTARC